MIKSGGMKGMVLGLIASFSLFCGIAAESSSAERLVILHTNDTHSQIDPNDKGLGGILRRKAAIDSVRATEPNVILIDAGDAVQGTLYFSLFKGEVERKMMNALGYDIQILGNHEFDNGMESLAEQWSKSDAARLCTNYDLRSTPLSGLTQPYIILETGGKKIAFIAINLDPEGMIAPANTEGLVYLDGVKAANATAWHLKHNEGADMVVAVTHIGYDDVQGYSDIDLIGKSEDIDLVIGGHTHTRIDPSDPNSPAWLIPNLDGDSILVAQTPKGGVCLGEIDIDLSNLKPTSRLINIDSRLDDRIDPEAEAILTPYRHSIDSIQSIKIGTARREFTTDTPGLLNLISDFVADEGSKIAGKKVDLAIMNRGGIRCGIPAGPVTQGRIMMMLPFDNRIRILEIKGSDLLEAFDIMASRGGDGISRSARAVIDPTSHKCSSVTIDGEPIDPEKSYLVATIDYLANGGDYMKPLTRARTVAESDEILYESLIGQFLHGPLKGKKLNPDETPRMSVKQ